MFLVLNDLLQRGKRLPRRNGRCSDFLSLKSTGAVFHKTPGSLNVLSADNFQAASVDLTRVVLFQVQIVFFISMSSLKIT